VRNKIIKKYIYLLLFVCIAIISLTKMSIISCSPIKKDITYNEISINDAKDRYNKGNYLFVDARNAFYFEMGHIKNAINIPVDRYNNMINLFKNKYPLKTYIVIYCDGTSCSSSYLLAKMLCNEGSTKIEVFFNGWGSWVDKSYPIDKGGNQ
jgi:rhodanese-related sulfurtransferase